MYEQRTRVYSRERYLDAHTRTHTQTQYREEKSLLSHKGIKMRAKFQHQTINYCRLIEAATRIPPYLRNMLQYNIYM